MQKKEKLTAHIRLNIYSYLETTEILSKISLLNTSIRESLPGSGIACEGREITLDITKAMSRSQPAMWTQYKPFKVIELGQLWMKYLTSIVSHVTMKIRSTEEEAYCGLVL